MNWFIIVGFFLALGITFIVFSHIGNYHSKNSFIYHLGFNKEEYGITGWALSIISSLFLFIMVISIFQLTDYENHVINEYNATKALIESYKGNEYGNISKLTEKVISINDVIAENKAYCNSKWKGPWNSEKIGNLEPITF